MTHETVGDYATSNGSRNLLGDPNILPPGTHKRENVKGENGALQTQLTFLAIHQLPEMHPDMT